MVGTEDVCFLFEYVATRKPVSHGFGLTHAQTFDRSGVVVVTESYLVPRAFSAWRAQKRLPKYTKNRGAFCCVKHDEISVFHLKQRLKLQ